MFDVLNINVISGLVKRYDENLGTIVHAVSKTVSLLLFQCLVTIPKLKSWLLSIH